MMRICYSNPFQSLMRTIYHMEWEWNRTANGIEKWRDIINKLESAFFVAFPRSRLLSGFGSPYSKTRQYSNGWWPSLREGCCVAQPTGSTSKVHNDREQLLLVFWAFCAGEKGRHGHAALVGNNWRVFGKEQYCRLMLSGDVHGRSAAHILQGEKLFYVTPAVSYTTKLCTVKSGSLTERWRAQHRRGNSLSIEGDARRTKVKAKPSKLFGRTNIENQTKSTLQSCLSFLVGSA